MEYGWYEFELAKAKYEEENGTSSVDISRDVLDDMGELPY